MASDPVECVHVTSEWWVNKKPDHVLTMIEEKALECCDEDFLAALKKDPFFRTMKTALSIGVKDGTYFRIICVNNKETNSAGAMVVAWEPTNLHDETTGLRHDGMDYALHFVNCHETRNKEIWEEDILASMLKTGDITTDGTNLFLEFHDRTTHQHCDE